MLYYVYGRMANPLELESAKKLATTCQGTGWLFAEYSLRQSGNPSKKAKIKMNSRGPSLGGRSSGNSIHSRGGGGGRGGFICRGGGGRLLFGRGGGQASGGRSIFEPPLSSSSSSHSGHYLGGRGGGGGGRNNNNNNNHNIGGRGGPHRYHHDEDRNNVSLGGGGGILMPSYSSLGHNISSSSSSSHHNGSVIGRRGGIGGGDVGGTGFGSYAELANSVVVMPSYADLGRDIADNNSHNHNSHHSSSSSRSTGERMSGPQPPPPSTSSSLSDVIGSTSGNNIARGEYGSMALQHDRLYNNNQKNHREKNMDSREGEFNYSIDGGNGGGGSSSSSSSSHVKGVSGSKLGSYAMMGVEMSGPHLEQQQQQRHQNGGWTKRSRPNNDTEFGGDVMMKERRGPPGVEGDSMDGPLFPRRGMDRDRGHVGSRAGPGGSMLGPAAAGGRGRGSLERGEASTTRVSSGDGTGRFQPRGVDWERDYTHQAGVGSGTSTTRPPTTDRISTITTTSDRVGAGDVVVDDRSNLAPPQDDQHYNRGIRDRNEAARYSSFGISEEDQFGRQQRPPYPPRTSGFRGGSGGGRDVPSSYSDRRGNNFTNPSDNQNLLQMNGRFVPSTGNEHQQPLKQSQSQLRPNPGGLPRGSGFIDSAPQRFDGHSETFIPASQPTTSSSQSPAPLKQPVEGQTTQVNDSVASNRTQRHHQEQQYRSQTSTPGAPNTSESSTNIVPESPTSPSREDNAHDGIRMSSILCPPSPPPAAPSAYALAVSRMMEMNEDMEFAHARLMMLEYEHRKIKARLEALETLQLEDGKSII